MESKWNLALGLTVALAGGFAVSSSADTLALFKTSDLVDAGGNDASDSPEAGGAAGVTSSDLTFGAGLAGQNWPNSLDSQGFFGNAGLADSLAGNDYITVTVTPDAGQSVDYSNFHVVIGANVSDGVVHLLSSATGFGVGDAIATINYTGGPGGSVPASTHDVDLTGVAALQGAASAVEFRLYISQVGNRIGIGQSFNTTDRDDLRIDGTVVPEPGSIALLGLGGVMVMLRKRAK